jgi:hypothetical protein
MPPRPIFLLTCKDKPEPDHDEGPLLDRLRREGLHASMLAWDAPDALDVLKAAASAGQKPLVIVRSTWNYYLHRTQFVSFLLVGAAAVAQVVNPLPVVSWNTDKSYLNDLAVSGIRVVPTQLLEAGTSLTEVARLAKQNNWQRTVLKPRVSAGSFLTFVLHDGAPKQDENVPIEAALVERDMLLQPFLAEVEQTQAEHGGEISVVCIQGEPSHAMQKRLRLAGQDEQTVSVPLRQDFADFARQVLAAAAKVQPAVRNCLYARVDSVLIDGMPTLMELELTEPSLFLNANPTGMDRFIAGVKSLLAP